MSCTNIVLTMSTQTVFRAGNSNVVAIPKGISKNLGIKRGSKVVVEEAPEGDRFVVRRANSVTPKKPAASKEFNKWLKDALKEDAGILDELAVR